MKRTLLLIAAIFAFSSAPSLRAQEQKSTEAQPLNEAETKFKDLLNNVTLEGRWFPVNDGQIGEQKQDKYTIVSVAKVKGDSWIVNTRMKYGQREIVAPLPIQVKWAGDTAVIVVDNMAIPNGGTYSARVLFYGKTYAGSWAGGEKGGVLSGIITPNKDK